MSAQALLWSLAAVHVGLAIVVVRALLRDDGLDTRQKARQSLFAVVLPIAGPLSLLFLMMFTHDRQRLRRLLPFPLFLLGRDPKDASVRRHDVGIAQSEWSGGDGGAGE